MKWEEVRNIYPNQFVKFEILKSHVDNETEYIDEIAVIDIIEDESATKELLNSRDDIMVYHTSKEIIALKIRSRIGLRRVFKDAN